MEFALNLLRWEDIRQKVIEFLKHNVSEDFDYDAENIRIFIDAISYVSMLMNYYVAFQANEYFIDTTTVRKNAVSIAKTLGYRPKRKISSKIFGYIYFKGSGFNENSKLVIPPRTYFIGNEKGQKWTNPFPITLTFFSSTLLKGEFTLVQGEWKTYRYYANGLPFQSFVIQDPNVEENYFDLFVKRSTDPDEKKKLWKEVKTFHQLLDKKIYFVEEDIVNEYCPRIIFGNGIIGEIPSQYDEVIVEYLRTEGSAGNYETGVDFEDVESLTITGTPEVLEVYNPANFIIEFPEKTYSYGGYDNESLEEIKVNATKYFYSAGRAVTKEDYRILISKWKNVYDFNITGFEELFPRDWKYSGYVFITAVPFINIESFSNRSKFYLTDSEELELHEYIKDFGIISIMKTFLRPSYIRIDLDVQVELQRYMDAEKVSKLVDESRKKLLNYFKNDLCRLEVDFRTSEICKRIKELDGVKSVNLDTDYYFGFHPKMFFRDKDNFSTLPVIKLVDENGKFIYDEFSGKIKTKNWIRKNTSIVKLLLREGKQYSVETLPPELSSFYGVLTHPNLKREIYNKDVKYQEIIRFYEENGLMFYQEVEFFDYNNVKHKAILKQDSENIWKVLVEGSAIGFIIRQVEENEIKYYFRFNLADQGEALKKFGFIEDYQLNQFVVNNVPVYSLWIKTDTHFADILLKETEIIKVKKGSFELIEDKSYRIGSDEYKLSVNFDDQQNQATFYLGEDIPLFVYDTSAKEIISQNRKMFEKLGWRFNSIEVLEKNDVIEFRIKGIFDGSSVGSMDYITGIIYWNDKIFGKLDDKANILSEFNLIDVFLKYEDQNKMDWIRLLPDVKETEFTMEEIKDFDSRFNTFILPVITSLGVIE